MKIDSDNSKENQQEKMIEKELRTAGFVFPQTVDEVKEFERIFGTTDVILPDELQVCNFINSPINNSNKAKVVITRPDNLAMAAREGYNSLPDEIKRRMAEDRKKADSNRKRKK